MRSARSNNNWKQSWRISCSHQSSSDQSLSPGAAPASHQSPCRTLGMQPSGMLGNEGWQGGIQASDYQSCWEERKDVSREGVWACLHLCARCLASSFIRRNSGRNVLDGKRYKQLRKERKGQRPTGGGWSMRGVYDRKETGIVVRTKSSRSCRLFKFRSSVSQTLWCQMFNNFVNVTQSRW